MTWCNSRGLLCDSDRVAFAHVLSNFAKNTSVGCGEVLGTLKVWPFVASSMTGLAIFKSIRAPYYVAVNYACPEWGTECGTNGLWQQCLLRQAEDKAGHPLTPAEQTKLFNDNPAP